MDRNTVDIEPVETEEEYLEEEYLEEESVEDEPLKISDDQREKRLKKRIRKKKRKRMLLPAILVLIALLVGLFFFARSDFFTVDKIKVYGNAHYTNAQIKEMCDAETGVNIFSVKKKHMEKLLMADPYISSAEIKMKLPDRLNINIAEREECGAVLSDKNYYIIDGTGLVLQIKSDRPKDIAVINGFTVTSGKEGEALSVKEAKAFNQTVSMMAKASKTTVAFRSVKVKNSVCRAYVKKKLYVKGLPADIEKCIKSGKLEAVLYDLYEKGVNRGKISIGSNEYCVFSP